MRGLVVTIATHCVAEDDRRAVAVEFLVRIAVVEKRLTGSNDGPDVGAIHRFGTLGGMGRRHASGSHSQSVTHPPIFE